MDLCPIQIQLVTNLVNERIDELTEMIAECDGEHWSDGVSKLDLIQERTLLEDALERLSE